MATAQWNCEPRPGLCCAIWPSGPARWSRRKSCTRPFGAMSSCRTTRSRRRWASCGGLFGTIHECRASSRPFTAGGFASSPECRGPRLGTGASSRRSRPRPPREWILRNPGGPRHRARDAPGHLPDRVRRRAPGGVPAGRTRHRQDLDRRGFPALAAGVGRRRPDRPWPVRGAARRGGSPTCRPWRPWSG